MLLETLLIMVATVALILSGRSVLRAMSTRTYQVSRTLYSCYVTLVLLCMIYALFSNDSVMSVRNLF